ncbi:type IA DNA topoisomerase [Clostridioides sp. ZZV14-6045]|uniref:type IA DNA topoisomerase n=1 Tax=Clostridioides sp. ZZV14-6045 TaxID=2811489 RepID=UPI001D112737|nr:type IA DNA topoisomerase [Clostridioides sp. ZZV14-6045]
MKKIFIAEKPSVAKNIADKFNIKNRQDGYFEGEDYIITWAYGHLFQLLDAKDYNEAMSVWKMDNFPFIPDKFKYKAKEDVKKQVNIIKKLINREDVNEIISATDFDREGELISHEILTCLKATKPIKRILLNEWTPEEIEKGMRNLRNNIDMKPLQDAGMSRQLADWIIGINLTSVSTLKYRNGNTKTINIGRVLLPTLKIIYDRDKEIENFVTSTYYKLLATFNTNKNELLEGVYYDENDNEKFDNEKTPDSLVSLIKGQKCKILNKEVERKKEKAPSLFNLSGLQGHVTSKYNNWTSDKVLKVAQSLYENKYITYPRTDSIALEESLKAKAERVLNVLKKGEPFEDKIKFSDSKKIFDNSKVESHSAIIPTYIIPKNLSPDESIVYTEIKNRFFMQFMPVAEYDETTLIIKTLVDGLKGCFISKGKIEIVTGWKEIEKRDAKDVLLPEVNENDILSIEDVSIGKVVRKPPKPHTEKTLLKIMQTCGKSFKNDDDSNEIMESVLSGFSIGTSATRADTIKKLKDTGYVETKGKSLSCTSLGVSLIENFPVRQLLDLEYTGKLEKTLLDIEKGLCRKEDFLNTIKDFTINAVALIKNDNSTLLLPASNNKKSTKPVIGKCPLCQGDIIENDKNFGCSNWKTGCKYAIWKNDKYIKTLGKKVTSTIVKRLLKDGKVEFNDLVSKKGTKYTAYLSYELDKDTGFFSWKMEFKK